MGKKPVQLEEVIHDEIENIQNEWTKQTGEDPPGKEKIIEKSIENTHPDQVLSDLFKEKKRKKEKSGSVSTVFDDHFSI